MTRPVNRLVNRPVNRPASLATAVVLALALAAGCASQPPAITASVADEMTRSVVEVADAASEGDLAGAVVTLDELQRQLDEAVAAERVTPDRGARVQLALDAVRADLTLLAAPAEASDAEPAPQEPVTSDPAVEQPVETPDVSGTPPAVETPAAPVVEPGTKGNGPGTGQGKGQEKGKGKGKDKSTD